MEPNIKKYHCLRTTYLAVFELVVAVAVVAVAVAVVSGLGNFLIENNLCALLLATVLALDGAVT